jgi:hypothetical protein
MVGFLGATSWDLGVVIAVDAAGDIYGTGQFRGQAPVGSITLKSQYSSKAFVGKLSSLGVFQWVARGGGHSAQGFACQTGIRAENVGEIDGLLVDEQLLELKGHLAAPRKVSRAVESRPTREEKVDCQERPHPWRISRF